MQRSGRVTAIAFVLALFFPSILSQQGDCQAGWTSYGGSCWYFSLGDGKPGLKLSWYEAESWCQTNGGHLTSFATSAEQTWAYTTQMAKYDQTFWWIGLNDIQQEGVWVWVDETPFNSEVSNWAPGEPNNVNTEQCAEAQVLNPAIRGLWNDRSCTTERNYICKAAPGTVPSCQEGWLQYGERCYRPFQEELDWHAAEGKCKLEGGNLVAIENSGEQAFVESIVQTFYRSFWVGLSDTVTPNTLAWSDVNTAYSYTNWASSYPQNPLPYYGSTCIDVDFELSYKWTTNKCATEKPYVCERGVRGSCPNAEWTYLNGKCYEFVVNPSRAMTWPSAKEYCQGMGASLLKIETDNQQKYLSSALEQYYDTGAQEIWLGGSDIGHDETYKWWDGTSILVDYWDVNQPQPDPGRENCMNLYTGKTTNNWESSTCFYSRQFICEIDEGQPLATAPVVTVEGECEEGWRHFNHLCYLFMDTSVTYTSASSACAANSAKLTSVLNDNELSFITGHLKASKSWIGLQCQNDICTWDDGSPYAFNNWDDQDSLSSGCVTTNQNGLWVKENCASNNGYICKKEEIPTPESTVVPPTPGSGPEYEKCGGNNWFSDPNSEKCYKVNIDLTRSWNDARYQCQREGGELASINSPDEQAFIESAIKGLPTVTNIYIGGTDRMPWQDGATDILVDQGWSWSDGSAFVFLNWNTTAIKGLPTVTNIYIGGTDRMPWQDGAEDILVDQGWSWSDGSAFVFLNWNTNEPNNVGDEDCMEINAATGKWNDLDCLYYRHFMCEKIGNGGTIVGDVEDDECRSNDACCFNRLGVEYGGKIQDDQLFSSSIRNEYYNTTRGRLNTPEDVLIIGDVDTPQGETTVAIGYGHGAWKPDMDDLTTSWFQVDFRTPTEVKGIITQGRNGYITPDEREWTTRFQISYSQDSRNTGEQVTGWEFIRDSTGQPVDFKGNFDQNTQVTNLFPNALLVMHIRCHIKEYKDDAAIRLEYIGCNAYCIYPMGMNAGNIPDQAITASSGDPKQARGPVDETQCLSDGSDNGESYRGYVSQTENGLDCQPWSSQQPHPHSETAQNNPDDGLNSNFCRNPGGKKDRPWCYTTDSTVQWEFCSIPVCPSYTPNGWVPSQQNKAEYVQVKFDQFYRVSGITVYSDASGSYVTKYYFSFSDYGTTFTYYETQSGDTRMFNGPIEKNSHYLDILQEPISTRYLRIIPQAWQNSPKLYFEIHGCYVDRRLTCADDGTTIDETSFQIDCPSGCVEDPNKGAVYGTDTYTESSAICPAAIHAGKIKNNLGGVIQVEKRNGISNYVGSSRHGITSLDWGASYQSIDFGGNTLRCEDEWTAWNEHCYYFSPANVYKTWHDARAECMKMGGDLASVVSEAENDFIFYMTVQDLSVDVLVNEVWFGLNDLDYQDYYQWSDGSPTTMSKWYLSEPNGGSERCGNFYRTVGFWNDNNCEYEFPFMCKKTMSLLPPVTTILPPTEPGCEMGWSAYGASCYWVSNDEAIYQYGEHICTEMDSHMVGISDSYEQAFVHQLVTSKLTPGRGYKSWIGVKANMDEYGAEYFTWQNGEPFIYSYWDVGQPDLPLKCVFPFEYQGVLYYECTTVYNPFILPDTEAWCSPTSVYVGMYLPCGTDEIAQGCGFMDETTGKWTLEFCNIENHYYTCEKSRIGYTEPVYTTASSEGGCKAEGWYTTDSLVDCYQINEYANRTQRQTWHNALDYCRAQGADLISVHSSQEEIEIANLIVQYGENNQDYFWLGLSQINVDGGYQWSDGTAVSYTNWAPDEPNDHNGNENCVESSLGTSGQWNDLNCDSVRNWICQIAKRLTPSPPPTFPPPEGQENGGCGTGWIKYTTDYGAEKCYYFEGTGSNFAGWSGAQDKCVEYGGNLVAIHSQDENTFVLSRTAQTTADMFWIGLKSYGDNSFMWADGTEVDYVNWAKYEPNNYLDTEDCVEYMVHSGLWNDNNCGVKGAYICEKCTSCYGQPPEPTPAVTGNCMPGYVAYGNKCFYASEISLSWYDAREFCTNNSADLAVVSNMNENAFLVSYLYGRHQTSWIGFSNRNYGQFIWADGTEVTYTNWDGGQPDNWNNEEGCAEVLMGDVNAGRWNDVNCNSAKRFVCYTKRDDTLSEPEPTDSPNDCPKGYRSWNNACYLLVNEAMTFDNARDYCVSEGKYTDLVSVEHVYENNFLHSMYWRDLQTGQTMWIGMRFTEQDSDPLESDYYIDGETSIEYPDTGQTRNVSFTWTDGWPIYYTSWSVGEPDQDNINTGSGCVYQNNDGTWSTAPTIGTASVTCATPMAFVCKYNTVPIPTQPPPFDGVCDPGFEGFENYCYYVQVGLSSATVRSWSEAADECYFRDAELASFHAENEIQFVINSIPGGSAHNLWIGLDHDGFSGWKWRDNTPVDFFYWANHEPNGLEGEQCVELYPWNGQWNDLDCFQRRGYICKKPKDSTICNIEQGNHHECGYEGISESYCVSRKGCCWDGILKNENFSGCFYAEGVGPSGIPIDTNSGSNLSVGAIIGIVVAALIAAAVVIGLIYYCCVMQEGKSFSGIGIPSMPKVPSFGSSAPKQEEKQTAGFDNPLAQESGGNQA